MKTLNITIFIVCFLGLSTDTWGRPNTSNICIPNSVVETKHSVCKCSDDGKDLKCSPEQEYHVSSKPKKYETKPQKSLGKTNSTADQWNKKIEERLQQIRKFNEEDKKRREEKNKEEEKINNQIWKQQEELDKMSKINWYEDKMPDLIQYHRLSGFNIKPSNINIHPIFKPEFRPEFKPEFRPFKFRPMII